MCSQSVGVFLSERNPCECVRGGLRWLSWHVPMRVGAVWDSHTSGQLDCFSVEEFPTFFYLRLSDYTCTNICGCSRDTGDTRTMCVCSRGWWRNVPVVGMTNQMDSLLGNHILLWLRLGS